MLHWIDARNFPTGTPLVGEIGMAADTKLAAPVNVQTHWVIGVIKLGAVAVFAAYGAMGRILDVVVFVFVTFRARCGGLVFYRDLFPVGLVGLAVPAVHIAPLMCSEVAWY